MQNKNFFKLNTNYWTAVTQYVTQVLLIIEKLKNYY